MTTTLHEHQSLQSSVPGLQNQCKISPRPIPDRALRGSTLPPRIAEHWFLLLFIRGVSKPPGLMGPPLVMEHWRSVKDGLSPPSD